MEILAFYLANSLTMETAYMYHKNRYSEKVPRYVPKQKRTTVYRFYRPPLLITCKNSIAGPIVNTQSVVVLVWIILGVSIKPGLCYDIPESLYGRTGIPYREHRTAVYRYLGISLHPYNPSDAVCIKSIDNDTILLAS